jgi:hypothetical protein
MVANKAVIHFVPVALVVVLTLVGIAIALPILKFVDAKELDLGFQRSFGFSPASFPKAEAQRRVTGTLHNLAIEFQMQEASLFGIPTETDEYNQKQPKVAVKGFELLQACQRALQQSFSVKEEAECERLLKRSE